MLHDDTATSQQQQQQQSSYFPTASHSGQQQNRPRRTSFAASQKPYERRTASAAGAKDGRLAGNSNEGGIAKQIYNFISQIARPLQSLFGGGGGGASNEAPQPKQSMDGMEEEQTGKLVRGGDNGALSGSVFHTPASSYSLAGRSSHPTSAAHKRRTTQIVKTPLQPAEELLVTDHREFEDYDRQLQAIPLFQTNPDRPQSVELQQSDNGMRDDSSSAHHTPSCYDDTLAVGNAIQQQQRLQYAGYTPHPAALYPANGSLKRLQLQQNQQHKQQPPASIARRQVGRANLLSMNGGGNPPSIVSTSPFRVSFARPLPTATTSAGGSGRRPTSSLLARAPAPQTSGSGRYLRPNLLAVDAETIGYQQEENDISNKKQRAENSYQPPAPVDQEMMESSMEFVPGFDESLLRSQQAAKQLLANLPQSTMRSVVSGLPPILKKRPAPIEVPSNESQESLAAATKHVRFQHAKKQYHGRGRYGLINDEDEDEGEGEDKGRGEGESINESSAVRVQFDSGRTALIKPLNGVCRDAQTSPAKPAIIESRIIANITATRASVSTSPTPPPPPSVSGGVEKPVAFAKPIIDDGSRLDSFTFGVADEESVTRSMVSEQKSIVCDEQAKPTVPTSFSLGNIGKNDEQQQPAFSSTTLAATHKKTEENSFGKSNDSTAKLANGFNCPTPSTNQPAQLFTTTINTTVTKRKNGDEGKDKTAFSFGAVDSAAEISDAAVKKPSFSFGSTSESTATGAPSFSFGSTNESTATGAPSFSFGSTNESTATGAPSFSFGSSLTAKVSETSQSDAKKPVAGTLNEASDSSAAKPAFSFGLTASQPAAMEPKPEQSAPTGGFSFGGKPTNSFGEGSKPAEKTDEIKPLFSFAAASSTADKPARGDDTKKPPQQVSGGFTFSSTNNNNISTVNNLAAQPQPQQQQPVVSFGSSATAAPSKTTTEEKPLFSFGSSTTASSFAQSQTQQQQQQQNPESKPVAAFTFNFGSSSTASNQPTLSAGTVNGSSGSAVASTSSSSNGFPFGPVSATVTSTAAEVKPAGAFYNSSGESNTKEPIKSTFNFGSNNTATPAVPSFQFSGGGSSISNGSVSNISGGISGNNTAAPNAASTTAAPFQFGNQQSSASGVFSFNSFGAPSSSNITANTSAANAAAPLFSFGTNLSAQPVAADMEMMASDSQPPAITAANNSSFNAPSQQIPQNITPSFSFGSALSAPPAQSAGTVFSAPTNAQQPAGVFSFGATPMTAAQPAAAFNFNNNTNTAVAPPPSTFSFNSGANSGAPMPGSVGFSIGGGGGGGAGGGASGSASGRHIAQPRSRRKR